MVYTYDFFHVHYLFEMLHHAIGIFVQMPTYTIYSLEYKTSGVS
jgi:hypothetical protein